jgi:small-conductance mechanosensitive channel
VVVPNADLFTDTVVVNTAFAQRRLEYDVGIGYGDAIEDARQVILAAISAVEGVLTDPPPDVLVMEFASAAVNLRVRWWIAPPKQADALDARDQVLTAIRAALSTHGIDLPFPTHQILFHDQTEEADGDRDLQREGGRPSISLGVTPDRPHAILTMPGDSVIPLVLSVALLLLFA